MTFATRAAAGRLLGQDLAKRRVQAHLVLGLPRGGVVVAAAVAATLRRPLDAVIVRKIGHPWHREFALGALAEGGVIVLDESYLGKHPAVRADLDAVIAEETQRLEEYQAKFRRTPALDLAGQCVLLVDDGLATGATMDVAVPVASTAAAERLGALADDLIALVVDPGFDAVGHYYAEFPQTSDEEVQALLRAGATAG